MWQCQNCETMNEGEECIVCGESRETSEALIQATLEAERRAAELAKAEAEARAAAEVSYEYEKSETAFSKYKLWIILGAAATAVLMIIMTVFIVIQSMYTYAENKLEHNDYQAAREMLSRIEFYRDAEDLLVECDYQEACNELYRGEHESARIMFLRISNYKDSRMKVKECDYREAIALLENDDLMGAYDAFEELGDYSDASEYLYTTRARIYSRGVDYYRDDSYYQAKTYFQKSNNYSRESDYLTLIEAHQSTINVSKLYNLIGFEDTKEILLSDEYIFEFLEGRWETSSGKYVRYETESDGGTHTWYNLPYTDGQYYKLEGGIHYHGSNSSGWKKQWRYTIENKNCIKAYCYKDGYTYTLYRQ